MKKRQWLLLVLMAASLVVLIGYRMWDSSAKDSESPNITIESGLLEVSTHDPESVLLQGVSARDSRDGDVTDSVVIESIGGITGDHQVTVTYAAFDKAGNVAKMSRVIRYTDYIAPRFALDAPLAFAYGSSFDIMDHVGAQDERDGDITHRVKATSLSSAPISDPGVYDIRLQVTNSLGDTEILTLQAEVYPAGNYNSQLTLTDYLIYLPQGSAFDAKDYLDTFSYSINSTDLSRGAPNDYHLTVSGKLDTALPGVYEVEYYQIYTAYSELVVVVEG